MNERYQYGVLAMIISVFHFFKDLLHDLNKTRGMLIL